MKRFKRWGLVASAALVLPGSMASARQYYTVADWTHVNGGASSTSYITGAWVEGRTLYSSVSQPGRLTKTTNLTQTLDGNTSGETYSEMTSNAQLSTAGVGQTSGTGGTVNVISLIYGFSSGKGAASNYIQFSESSSDAVYRVDKNTGVITPYVTRAQFTTALAGTGVTNAQLVSSSDSTPDGEFVSFESSIGQFVKTNGPGAATVFATQAALAAATGTTGSAVASGGVTFDAAGNFYFGSGNSTASQKAIYKMTPGGAISPVLNFSQISAITGNSTTLTFRDMFYAPDGYIYFHDGASAGILRFDPLNPAATLMAYLTATDLQNGPAAGSNAIQTLSWYDNGAGNAGIAFNYSNSTGAKGFYFAPEPASVVLLGLGGLLLRRRQTVKA